MKATNKASIRVNEEGNYTCRATSKYGMDERTIIVNGKRNQISLIPFSRV